MQSSQVCKITLRKELQSNLLRSPSRNRKNRFLMNFLAHMSKVCPEFFKDFFVYLFLYFFVYFFISLFIYLFVCLVSKEFLGFLKKWKQVFNELLFSLFI